MKKIGTEQVGTTDTGVGVISHVFKMYDTFGLPLSVVIDHLKSKNLVPAWDMFIKDALDAGWKAKKITTCIQEAIVDTDGRDHWKAMEDKVLICLEKYAKV